MENKKQMENLKTLGFDSKNTFKNKYMYFAIIISIYTIILIGFSAFTLFNNAHLKTQLNTEKAKVLNLSGQLSERDMAIDTLKVDNQKALDEQNRLSDAGITIISMLTKMEDMFLRLDEIYVKEHNYVVNNVNFLQSGADTMNYYMAKEKAIQKEYMDFIDLMKAGLNN